MGLIVTLLLGLFIVIGSLITFASKNNNKFMNFSLSLALSVMVMLIFMDLIPEIRELFIENYGFTKGVLLSLIGTAMGFGILKLLDIFIPDHEGHEKEKLHHIGLISSIALILHNIIEGMAVYTAINTSLRTGLLICLGVGLHNIPLGMVITSTFYKANNNKLKTWLIITLVSLSTFVGGLIMMLLQNVLVHEMFLGTLLCITLGMLIYISLLELFPKVIEMKDKKVTVYGVITGIVIMLVTLFIE